ncbi:hypothetical protein CEE69_11620 [Rhodopirellula bahusiensis]|uniref:Uncharacterized protein n=1 Tax=Rhodopirellula bahusiensis TaxID=2014065 RepID=A0A2G1W7T0_9BACT|nr:hypothetical protein CEE69_11620 [Rhodopirellula bahusiensis]
MSRPSDAHQPPEEVVAGEATPDTVTSGCITSELGLSIKRHARSRFPGSSIPRQLDSPAAQFASGSIPQWTSRSLAARTPCAPSNGVLAVGWSLYHFNKSPSSSLTKQIT